MRDTLRGIEDQIDQIGMRASAAGFKPLEADLARIRREFAAMVDRLEALDAQLQRTRAGATPERQAEIDMARARIADIQPQMAEAQANALQRASGARQQAPHSSRRRPGWTRCANFQAPKVFRLGHRAR